jgi:hypothetical protein
MVVSERLRTTQARRGIRGGMNASRVSCSAVNFGVVSFTAPAGVGSGTVGRTAGRLGRGAPGAARADRRARGCIGDGGRASARA